MADFWDSAFGLYSALYDRRRTFGSLYSAFRMGRNFGRGVLEHGRKGRSSQAAKTITNGGLCDAGHCDFNTVG